ncbi:hypothetical protein SJA_C1-22570 [Sphingobium indicum UT26S]|uniref:Uncharacterized protein n=1 Tax=Sphingobium indicum (strain DSM 16413 / CCM 7287 / MTCC 6362 / UT26 / NBRC 101211 / UT26S) TaxID=452662 RepID=D4Z3A9_SPHIU|nr:hypothetical protein SJA_C1-22570 [Sphingobium indicum UT26S]
MLLRKQEFRPGRLLLLPEPGLSRSASLLGGARRRHLHWTFQAKFPRGRVASSILFLNGTDANRFVYGALQAESWLIRDDFQRCGRRRRSSHEMGLSRIA